MRSRSVITIVCTTVLAACVHINNDKPIFGDSEVAMVMRVANLGEVREGEVAREKAADASVREFATMMVTEHSAANSKAESELSKAEIVSADSTLSRQLDAESGTATENLRTLTGRNFDRAYMQRQIQVHQNVLNLIDSKLLPVVRKKIVKEQLNAMRTAVQQHLTRAQQTAAAIPAN